MALMPIFWGRVAMMVGIVRKRDVDSLELGGNEKESCELINEVEGGEAGWSRIKRCQGSGDLCGVANKTTTVGWWQAQCSPRLCGFYEMGCTNQK